MISNIKINNSDFKYSITLLIILFVNILLCGYTLISFTYSTIAILTNIVYLLASVVLIANINNNKILNYLFHSLNILQIFVCWHCNDNIDINLQIHKLVLLLSLLILNFCKMEYDRQNDLINNYEDSIFDIDSDEEDEKLSTII
ncbi:hypothetical protein ACO0R3_004035 [Hanseniaspora guilliermondii]